MKLPIFLTLDEAKNWLQANVLAGTVTVGDLIDTVAPSMVKTNHPDKPVISQAQYDMLIGSLSRCLKIKNPALGRPRKDKEEK